VAEAPPFRILPRVTSNNEFFWTGGLHDELRFLRCKDDGYYIHPPQPICPICHGKNLAPETVSGRGTVVTYTVNHQPWMPVPELPYVVALVEIEEQAGMRLMTNIEGIPPEDVRIGLEVEVAFEHHVDDAGDVWIPIFQPRSGKGA
jgi:uncharacterized OB-fold protein